MEQPFFKIDKALLERADMAEEKARGQFAKIDANYEYNANKVLAAFIKNGVSESHFAGSTGYGYGDRGRETIERVTADIFGAPDSLMRHNFVSGTHAITTALFGVLRPGDRLVSLTGTPYDTLCPAIGIAPGGQGSLVDFGIKYEQLELLHDGTPDYDNAARAAKGAAVAYIQRSRGYTLRPSLSTSAIKRLADAVHTSSPSTIVMVDNCYGEFVERVEPTQCGADVAVGSLIKNPGGGIAKTGGYIAGRSDIVELCAQRLTAPGVGREVGCTLGESRSLFMGLFNAPAVVASALKTAVFASAFFSSAGFEVTPPPDGERADIIQAVKLLTPEALVAFCQGIQRGAPVDAFVSPEPWDMPGYESKVIMAAGAFTLGASIELSADGPMREPYAAWMQGGLNYPTGKTGVLLAAQSMLEAGELKL